MSYKYQEPTEREYEPLEPGEYDFVVTDVQDTYTNNNGNFILPVEITLKGTKINIRSWLAAGMSRKGKPFDMIAPFLKCVRKNPAVDEQPDFSPKSLIGARGRAKVDNEEYSGNDAKHKGKNFPAVAEWLYDRQQTTATVSQGDKAQPKSYDKPAAASSAPKAQPEDDDIPF